MIRIFTVLTFLFTSSQLFADEQLHTGPAEQSTSLLETFPNGWIGDTNQYKAYDSIITLRPDRAKTSTILCPVTNVDSIGFHLDKWGFELSSQNNYGIILSTDRYIDSTIGQASWIGCFISITGNNDTSQIKFNTHTGNRNVSTRLGILDLDKAANGLDFSIIYLSNGSIKYKITYSNSEHEMFCDRTTDILSGGAKNFGIYTNLSMSEANRCNSISVRNLTAKSYNKNYQFVGRGSINDATNWLPERLISLHSDNLVISDTDSASISQNSWNNQISLKNSKLYVLNTSTTENTVLTITNNLSIDSSSSIYMTNSITSKRHCIINIIQKATAQIFGYIELNGKGTIPKHKIIGADSASIVFEPSSRMVVLRLDGCPFERNGNYPAVVFRSGAVFEEYDGESPLVNSGGVPQSYFQTGSIYRYFGGGITWNNANYSILELCAQGTTKINMGGYGSCTIDHLNIVRGKYVFGLQGSNKPVNITITDSLTIADGCLLSISPDSVLAFSSIRIAASKLSGKGALIVGQYAALETSNPLISWKLRTSIAGTLRFGDKSIIDLDSVTMNVSGTIVNADQTSFIATPSDVENTSAYLVRPVNGVDASVLFPVGTLEYGYSPMTISHNTGANANFSVRSFVGVYENGLYGNPLHDARFLNNTWEITPDAAASVDVEIAWQKTAEGGAFDRNVSKMMINHHRPSSDVWIPTGKSQFNENELFSVKSLAVTDFSTVTALGESAPLAIYFNNFEAVRSQSSIQLSWIQAIPTDSVQIFVSTDMQNFVNVQTEYSGYMGRIVSRIPYAAQQLVYLKMEQYQNGQIVETSEIIAVHASGGGDNELEVTIVGSVAVIEKAEAEPVLITLISPSGAMISSSQISDSGSRVLYQLPSRCHPCIVHAENGSSQASAIRLNPE